MFFLDGSSFYCLVSKTLCASDIFWWKNWHIYVCYWLKVGNSVPHSYNRSALQLESPRATCATLTACLDCSKGESVHSDYTQTLSELPPSPPKAQGLFLSVWKDSCWREEGRKERNKQKFFCRCTKLSWGREGTQKEAAAFAPFPSSLPPSSYLGVYYSQLRLRGNLANRNST